MSRHRYGYRRTQGTGKGGADGRTHKSYGRRWLNTALPTRPLLTRPHSPMHIDCCRFMVRLGQFLEFVTHHTGILSISRDWCCYFDAHNSLERPGFQGCKWTFSQFLLLFLCSYSSKTLLHFLLGNVNFSGNSSPIGVGQLLEFAGDFLLLML